MKQLVLLFALAISLSACGPEQARPKTPAAKTQPYARKCPDLDLRDIEDPCSPMYLHRQKPRFTRDSL